MIKAILHVNNLSVNVLYYEFEFKKITDEKWQPYPGARFEGLVVKVEGSENNMWWEHAIADHMPISKATRSTRPAKNHLPPLLQLPYYQLQIAVFFRE